MGDRLTNSEAAVLLVLMAEARAVSNPDLARLGPQLGKASREKLAHMGLIEVGASNRQVSVELTDRGWKYCADLMGTDPIDRSNGSDRALFTVLAGIRRWLDQSGSRASEIFSPRPENKASEQAEKSDETVDIEASIRTAYARLAREPGSTVRLSRLRNELHDIPRSDLDDALARLRRASDVSLIPEENQKTLTDEDRAAAVVVGNQQNHLLSIEA
ncbi:hypothetical protein [Rhodococcus sp. IEGM1428]|uniref:hypothetical protein n=1 Tax=Rhodococcus sp. IEGM1428 TaxID=3392191 RepID=UPI003D102C1E